MTNSGTRLKIAALLLFFLSATCILLWCMEAVQRDNGRTLGAQSKVNKEPSEIPQITLTQNDEGTTVVNFLNVRSNCMATAKIPLTELIGLPVSGRVHCKTTCGCLQATTVKTRAGLLYPDELEVTVRGKADKGDSIEFICGLTESETEIFRAQVSVRNVPDLFFEPSMLEVKSYSGSHMHHLMTSASIVAGRIFHEDLRISCDSNAIKPVLNRLNYLAAGSSASLSLLVYARVRERTIATLTVESLQSSKIGLPIVLLPADEHITSGSFL